MNNSTWLERNWGWLFWVIFAFLGIIFEVRPIAWLVMAFICGAVYFHFKDLEEERKEEYLREKHLYEQDIKKRSF